MAAWHHTRADFTNIESEDTLTAELKLLQITLNEVALYRDRTASTLTSSPFSHLWQLLVATRDYLSYILSVPRDAARILPAGFLNSLAYALIVLSTITHLPSSTGWDSSVAKREANFIDTAQRAQEFFGNSLTSTSDDVSMEEKDVWQFFARGLGGLIAWHQHFEARREGGIEYELSISPAGGPLNRSITDIMTAFMSLRVRRPPQPVSMATPVTQNGLTDTPGNAGIPERTDTQSDNIWNFWEEDVWQSIFDDYPMFGTTAAFPVSPPGQP